MRESETAFQMGSSGTPIIIHALLCCCACLLIPASCLNHHPQKHVALFVFGDSLFDVGNNKYINTTDQRANFWPYGETFFGHPSGRFSDGRLIPDFLAKYAKLPFLPPYLQPGSDGLLTHGANFAFAGAGALDETHQGKVINLNTQLTYFKNMKKLLSLKLGDEAAKKILFEAVYLISIGSNDYLSPFTGSTKLQYYPPKLYRHMVIGNLTAVIKEIYNKGGRKFGFLNLGPLGCLPSMKAIKKPGTGECIEEASEQAKLHNIAMSKVLQKLHNKLQGFKYSMFDLYTTLEERMDNPSKYGFKDGKTACCGSGPYRALVSCGGEGKTKEYELCSNTKEYVFFDGAHPTDKANQQMTKLMWSGTHNITRPYNLKQLFC